MNTGSRPEAVNVIGSLPPRQVTLSLAGVMLAMFLSSLNQTVVSTAMPRIITDLGGFSQYAWVTTSFLITSTVVVPITGKLTDMYGRKLFYIAGILIFTIGSLLCGFSQSITQIIIFRGIQGLGAGVMMTNAFTVIGDLFPPGERGKYSGLLSAMFGISSVIGPTLGGFITDTLSWHWVFFINVPLGFFVIGMFLRFFPNLRPSHVKHKVDYWGVVTLVLAVVPAMIALSWGGVEYPWASSQIISMFVFSVIMLGVFLYIEGKGHEPIIPFSLFKNRVVTVSLVITFITGISTFGVITFVPLFFQGVMGATATASGSFLTPMMLGTVIGSIVSGQMLSRTGGHYKLQGAIGIILTGTGLALLWRMTPTTSYGIAVMNITFTGFGQGILMPCYTLAVQNSVPNRVLGVATSASLFFRSIGSTLGIAVFGSVMANRFSSAFLTGVSPEIKAVLPPDQLSALVDNPQVLVNPEAQMRLKELFDGLGMEGPTLFEKVLVTLQESLGSAISLIFLIALGIILIAFITNLFFKGGKPGDLQDR